jgi:hypothetical protein
VPADLRRQLERDPRFAGAGAVMRMALGIDLRAAAARPDGGAGPADGASGGAAAPGGGGLDAIFTADLATAAEASALAAKVVAALRDAKRDPRLLMLGIGPDLDGVVSQAEGRTFSLRVKLGEDQVSDLLQRARALLLLARQGQIPGFAP